MRKYVEEEYDKFETRRKKEDTVAADKKDLEELEEEVRMIRD